MTNSFVSTDANQYDNEVSLVSPYGRWNKKIKAFIVAAYEVHMGKTPQQLVDLFLERNVGIKQTEFVVPFGMTLMKFPMSFERSLHEDLDESKRKNVCEGKHPYAAYLFNRLFYCYSSTHVRKAKFFVSSEHPVSKKPDDALKLWYDEYLKELKDKKEHPSRYLEEDLRECLATMYLFAPVLQYAMTRASSVLSQIEAQRRA